MDTVTRLLQFCTQRLGDSEPSAWNTPGETISEIQEDTGRDRERQEEIGRESERQGETVASFIEGEC